MGLVKLKGVKTTTKASIKYICNTFKNLDGYLISGHNTIADVDYTANKMESLRVKYGKYRNKNQCFHIIHSFSNKDKIDPELAHEISMKWAEKVFNKSDVYISSTHINEKHIHTHFIVNNVGIDGSTPCMDFAWHRMARNISNELCKEYGLINSIINTERGRGRTPSKSWYEYKNFQANRSWKQFIRDDIDNLIPKVKNLDNLYFELRNKGYELKLDGKYAALKPNDKDRFTRFKTLGYMYEPDMLKDRIIGLDKYDIPLNSSTKRYKSNKYLDKEIYYYTFRKGSIGCILQLTAKIISESLNLNENNKKYASNNWKAKKELNILESALDTIKNKNYDNLEDINKDYNKTLQELNKIEQWQNKYNKAISLNKDLADKLNEQYEKVKTKQQQLENDKEKTEEVIKSFKYCKEKKYKDLYKENNSKELEK
mgnify:CR=1 FL=1